MYKEAKARMGAFCHAGQQSQGFLKTRHRLKQRGVKEDRKRAPGCHSRSGWGFRGRPFGFRSRFDGDVVYMFVGDQGA